MILFEIYFISHDVTLEVVYPFVLFLSLLQEFKLYINDCT